MRTKIASILSFAVLFLLCGCLEFEEQSMAYRYDEKTDTLYIFQDYQGISTGSGEKLSADEVQQLDSVLKTERTFFFANWIFEYNREAMLEAQKEWPAASVDSSLTPGERKQVLGLVELLLENVKVENGPFYFDASKRLCGVQKVTLKKASQIVRTANEVMPIALKGMAQKQEDAADKAVLLKAAGKRKEFIRLEKNVLSFVWPMTQPEYEETFGPKTENPEVMVAFKKSGGKIDFKDDEVHFSLGTPQDRITTLSLPVAKAEKDYKGYKPNAVEEVKKRAVILEKFDVEAARKEFLK